MQVFKLFIKIVKSRIGSSIMYLVIFLGIGIITAANATHDDGFQDEKMILSIIDLDNSSQSQILSDHFSEQYETYDVENDKDKILDALYYQTTDYVLIIKQGYEEKLQNGETDDLFENYAVPNSFQGEFFNNDLDQFVRDVNAYTAGGASLDDAVQKAFDAQKIDAEVKLETFSKGVSEAKIPTGLFYYTQYLPYVFLAVLMSGLCPTVQVLMKKEVRNRMNCSALSSNRQMLQMFAGVAAYLILLWAVIMISATFMFKGELYTTAGLLTLLNGFVFLLVAAGIAMLISVFNPAESAVNLIANVVSLGMCFLCGIFVPQQFLGDGVLLAAKFLPAYWFVRANNMIGGMGEAYDLTKYMEYIGIEFLFAAALFAMTMLINRIKRKSA